MFRPADRPSCANDASLSTPLPLPRMRAWDQTFDALETRLRAVAGLAIAGRPPSADATQQLLAGLQACLHDLQRIHSDFSVERSRRRGLEQEVFDARAARLHASLEPWRGRSAPPPQLVAHGAEPRFDHSGPHLTPTTGDRA